MVKEPEPTTLATEEAENHDHDRKAYDTAGCFQYHHNAQKAYHRIGGGHGTGAENQLLVVDQDIEWRNHGQHCEKQVKRMESAAFDPGFLRRTEKEYKADTEG